MKEEDKRIEYRPKLADKLESCMKDAIRLYREEPKKVYYLLMSLLCKEKEDLEGKELFLIFLKKLKITQNTTMLSLTSMQRTGTYSKRVEDLFTKKTFK